MSCYFFIRSFFMKNVKGILFPVIVALFSLGFTLTAFASDLTKSLTDAAGAVVDSAKNSAIDTAKEKAGEAMANAVGEEAKEEAAAAGEEAKEEAKAAEENKDEAAADEKKE
jgi:hypothetical protein